MPTTIHPSLKTIQQEVTSLDIQAKKDQGVQSADFNKVIGELDVIAHDPEGVDLDKLNSLRADVEAMRALTAEPEKNSSRTNAAWDKGFADINALLNGMGAIGTISQVTGGHGPGTAFKGLNAADAKKAGLPDTIAALQNAKNREDSVQVNQIRDGAGKSYYISSGNNAEKTTYTVYDDAGKSMGQLKVPGALGLNDGKTWLALGEGGIETAWTTDDPKSLAADAQLYDLNGAAANGGKIVDRGLNGGGSKSAAPAAKDASPPPAPSPAPAGAAQTTDAAKTTPPAAAAPGGAAATLVSDPAKLPSSLKKIKEPIFAVATDPPSYVFKTDDKHYGIYNEDGDAKVNDLDMTKPSLLKLKNGKYFELPTSGDLTQAKTYDNPKDVPEAYSKGLYNGDGKQIAMPASLAQSMHGTDSKDGSKPKYGNWYTFFAGATSTTGTVYADVRQPRADGTDTHEHSVGLKNEKGVDITPTGDKGLDAGQFGSLTYKNGAQYIASEKGYFMVTEGLARNIVTGETVQGDAVKAIVDSAKSLPNFKQEDIEAENKRKG